MSLTGMPTESTATGVAARALSRTHQLSATNRARNLGMFFMASGRQRFVSAGAPQAGRDQVADAQAPGKDGERGIHPADPRQHAAIGNIQSLQAMHAALGVNHG